MVDHECAHHRGFPHILFWPGPWFSCRHLIAHGAPSSSCHLSATNFGNVEVLRARWLGAEAFLLRWVPWLPQKLQPGLPQGIPSHPGTWGCGPCIYTESFPCSTTWGGKRGQFPWPGGIEPPVHSRSADHRGSLLRWSRHSRLGFLSNFNVGRKSCWFNTAWRENCSPAIISLLCKTGPNFH